MERIANLPRLKGPKKQERREISWNCLCCHDSGYVVNHLVRQYLIEDYEWTDAPMYCCRPGCRGGLDHNGQSRIPKEGVDYRATPEMCQKIHDAEVKVFRAGPDQSFRAESFVADAVSQVSEAMAMGGAQ